MHRFNAFSLNLRGRLVTFNQPAVMGIINVTDNSFYAQSRACTISDVAERARQMIEQGAGMIDLGACSTAPGSPPVPPEEEKRRLIEGVEGVRSVAPDVILSVDTFRADVARAAIEAGADIVNDVTGGDGDAAMFDTVADLRVPYILMHSRGNAVDMQQLTDYPQGVVAGVVEDLSHKMRRLLLLGVADVIIDPGFGFAKTFEQNYQLLAHLSYVRRMLDAPLLVGVSRKSMIYKPLMTTPDEALNGTTVIDTLALTQGAAIIRVHDVKAAVETVKLYQLTADQL